MERILPASKYQGHVRTLVEIQIFLLLISAQWNITVYCIGTQRHREWTGQLGRVLNYQLQNYDFKFSIVMSLKGKMYAVALRAQVRRLQVALGTGLRMLAVSCVIAVCRVQDCESSESAGNLFWNLFLIVSEVWIVPLAAPAAVCRHVSRLATYWRTFLKHNVFRSWAFNSE